MTIFGWDASGFDWARGSMDLASAAADGMVWFTHKATEGVSVTHQQVGEALRRARDAGIEFLGAYHVVRSRPSAAAQVAYLLSTLDSLVPWWRSWPGFFLQVDLEKWDYDHVSAATGLAFTAALVEAQPKRVVLYASRGQYGDQLADTRELGVPLWNADYGANPAVPYRRAYPGDDSGRWAPYSGQTPMLLQFGSRAVIGSQPGCDANAFRGSLEQLRALIQGDDDMLDFNQNAKLDGLFNVAPTVKLDTGGGVLKNFPNPLAVVLQGLAGDVATVKNRPPVVVDSVSLVAAMAAAPEFLDALGATVVRRLPDPSAEVAELRAELAALRARLADALADRSAGAGPAGP